MGLVAFISDPEELVELLGHHDENIRRAALDRLAELPLPPDPHWRFCMIMGSAIKKINDLGELPKYLAHWDEIVRQAAVKKLEELVKDASVKEDLY